MPLEQLIPGRGVYAVKAYIEGFSYKAMLNIGWRPTLDNGHDQSIEAHLLDYEGGELYGKQLSIVFTAAYAMNSVSKALRHCKRS